MSVAKIQKVSIWKPLVDFIIHLRLHYQVFILSGGYLMGGYLSDGLNGLPFALQFLNVHLLLFGGATAYNSFWDKDNGPVGGLKHPPPMKNWMRFASLLLQMIGFLWALSAGVLYAFVYFISMLLFWLYSSPTFRWKGSPLKSLAAIGISTGTNSLLLGFLAAGNSSVGLHIVIAAAGVGCIILSFYPLSQIYQIDEDKKRGDLTFARKYGRSGIKKFFSIAFSLGVILLVWPLANLNGILGAVWLATGGLIGWWVYRQFARLTASYKDYDKAMRIKYGASLSFVIFIGFLLLNKHFF